MGDEHRIESYDGAETLVTDAKENDKAIRLDRIGATPWLKFTPYTNNRGVTINMWSCISYKLSRRPGKTLLGLPAVVKPWDHDDWEINHISTPWVIRQVKQSRIVKVCDVSESPFRGGILGGWND